MVIENKKERARGNKNENMRGEREGETDRQTENESMRERERQRDRKREVDGGGVGGGGEGRTVHKKEVDLFHTWRATGWRCWDEDSPATMAMTRSQGTDDGMACCSAHLNILPTRTGH